MKRSLKHKDELTLTQLGVDLRIEEGIRLHVQGVTEQSAKNTNVPVSSICKKGKLVEHNMQRNILENSPEHPYSKSKI